MFSFRRGRNGGRSPSENRVGVVHMVFNGFSIIFINALVVLINMW